MPENPQPDWLFADYPGRNLQEQQLTAISSALVKNNVKALQRQFSKKIPIDPPFLTDDS